jgi:integrase/recombinase XerC
MNQLSHVPISPPDMMLADPEPGHVLGLVADDWEAADVWLRAVRAKSRNGSNQTEQTYRYHLAKLRWYCEQVAYVTPSRWSTQDVERFNRFLQDLPNDALCAHRAGAGEPGWTPFRTQPSRSSQADIRRFVHALFQAWHKTGYIRINPMALTGAGTARKVNGQRAISLDLYDLVLNVMEQEEKRTFTERQMHVRDNFIFQTLRGLGLRASELVNARMSAFYQLSVAKTSKRYWVFLVTAETAKGGKERRIPVPRTVWDAFMVYRAAFGLPVQPTPGETTRLVLSPRTKEVKIGTTPIARTADRRFFKAWREVSTRQGLYGIVKDRLNRAADTLESNGRDDEATQLRRASPHWLRHTFGKAALLTGQSMREVAGALGHANMDTTMIYTEQDAIDLIDAWERASPGTVAEEASA